MEQNPSRTEQQTKALVPVKEDEPLTPDLLRQFPGCEHYADEQAREIVSTLRQLAGILYNLAISEETPKVGCWPDEANEFFEKTEQDVSDRNLAA